MPRWRSSVETSIIDQDAEPVMEDKVSEVDQPPSSLAQDETST